MAYIVFARPIGAIVFAALAGPASWGSAVFGSRRAEPDEAAKSEFDHWVLRDEMVRFPNRDLRRAEKAIKSVKSTLADLVGAGSR
jgi:hypothetical protein